MVFNPLFGRDFRSEPAGTPTLYPDLNPLQLEQFLAEHDYARIKSFDNVYILPFASRESEPMQICFGLGLARLMIRNLMLLRDVSIHGPEDTWEVPCEAIHDIAQAQPRSCHVTGVANVGSDGYSLQVEAHRPGRPVNSTRVRHGNFKAFLSECSSAIAQLLGSKVDESIAKAWNVAQPRNANSLIQLGKIRLDFKQQIVERGRAAQKLLDIDPDFVVPMWDIDQELAGAKQTFLTGPKRDPYNAQLCFLTFLTTWTPKGPQPEALQYCRKAIELSPGHGKAHMCAPHAAQQQVKMLRHSELGYRLLPGNSFAINNYTIALTRANAPAAKRIELAEEGIAADPRDPGSYLRLIEVCTSLGDLETALATAERLQRLYEPKMDERALYCLRQNPWIAKLIDSGEYDPVAENRRRIAELRGRVYENQGKLEAAIAEYRAAIQLKPDFAVDHFNLGIFLRKQGKPEEAIAEFRTAVQLKPDLAQAYHKRGTALQNQGKLEAAIAEFRNAIQLKPDFAEAHCNLGRSAQAGKAGRSDRRIPQGHPAQPRLRRSPHESRQHPGSPGEAGRGDRRRPRGDPPQA